MQAPDAVQEEYIALLRTYTVSPLAVGTVSGSDDDEKTLGQADERRIRAIAALAKVSAVGNSGHDGDGDGDGVLVVVDARGLQ